MTQKDMQAGILRSLTFLEFNFDILLLITYIFRSRQYKVLQWNIWRKYLNVQKLLVWVKQMEKEEIEIAV